MKTKDITQTTTAREGKEAVMVAISSLIQAVADAATHSDLCDAYMAARNPCLAAGSMASLLDANDAAERRLGDAPIVPLVMIG